MGIGQAHLAGVISRKKEELATLERALIILEADEQTILVPETAEDTPKKHYKKHKRMGRPPGSKSKKKVTEQIDEGATCAGCKKPIINIKCRTILAGKPYHRICLRWHSPSARKPAAITAHGERAREDDLSNEELEERARNSEKFGGDI